MMAESGGYSWVPFVFPCGLPGVLVCRRNRLVSGSNTKRIRLWAVAAVQELRLKGPDAR